MRLTLTGLILLPFVLFGQTVTIRQVQLAGEKVIVIYDLEDSNPNNEFLLNLYASKDNFTVPLAKVNGDVGMEIKPGSGKKIEWSIIEEFGGYKGKISLEVRGKVYVPFVRLKGFDTKKSYKRGKSYPITWKPGSTTPIVIELYNGGQRVSGDVNQPNNGSYTLFIPEHAKNGSDYHLKITDSKNPDEVINTGAFKVSARFPGFLKYGLPALAVTGLVIYLITKEPPPAKAAGIEDPDFPQ